MQESKTIAQGNKFIILEKYTKIESGSSYQSEADLEKELIEDLQKQGYEYLPTINNQEKLLENLRIQIQTLNNVTFSDLEWKRFLDEYLHSPRDGIIERTRKIHEDYIYDFVFDNGVQKNIYIIEKKNITKNKLQVINQFTQEGKHLNRYDVTILINGLPLVQIELKKRGESIREAFNQIHRYSKESFNSDNSLYKYLQIFIISNGTDTRYFANTTKRDKNSFAFTMQWARFDNTTIKDLKDFTATFLQKNTLLNVLIHYCVFDVTQTLLIMRPYQIAAAERIIWKIKSSHEAKKYSTVEGGGYIWHTTGSGKTLTSFKAARLATELDFIAKVFFVVDRKDLDYQTMKEYQRFSPDSVNGSRDTAGLKRNIEKDDNKIIVTTIQKLNNLMKSESNLEIYSKEVVFIFDEAHRSQFGEAQKNLHKKFKKFYQFGFTGTPIFPENALGAETTGGVFGEQLHHYVITDAIRDEKVLKFKVDYNNVRPKFKDMESEQDELKLSAFETKEALLHPDRINEISKYILHNFDQKTHRFQAGAKGFNAMFAVGSVEAAKRYYEALKILQKEENRALKIATIFSYAPNEEQKAAGEIEEEGFEPSALDKSAKEFLSLAIEDYNAMFGTSFGVDGKEFENYYKDLAKKVKSKEVDLLIVVGMFLTGFDAPTLNTLFVDKNLRYHGLIQAYSRTNRIYDSTKSFGNIITFRDLEKATIDAIALFGDQNTKNVILEKSYAEYMEGFTDSATNEAKKGFLEITRELKERFPEPSAIESEQEKRDFVKLFGDYLKVENILQNYDEFSALKALQKIDQENRESVEAFKEKHYLSDEDFNKIKGVEIPSERILQDYKSTYNDIREWSMRERETKQKEKSKIDWSSVEFEIDLLKSQEIDLDYILELIFEKNQKSGDKESMIEEARRLIKSSIGNRAKEGLIVDFIQQADWDNIHSKGMVIDEFYRFASAECKKEIEALIAHEKLNEKEARRYIATSLRRQYASDQGEDLKNTLPKISPMKPEYHTKRATVFRKIIDLVEKFKGITKGDS